MSACPTHGHPSRALLPLRSVAKLQQDVGQGEGGDEDRIVDRRGSSRLVVAGWPNAWKDLDRELQAGRGRPALIERTAPGGETLIDALGAVIGRTVSIGNVIAAESTREQVQEQLDQLMGPVLLRDMEVLFTPGLSLNVLAQMRRVARHGSVVVAWPGRIHAGRLTYSSPGRSDYFDVEARDIVVLRPVETFFPDEIPYTVERFPA